jgi:hypothetical protein
MPEHLVNAVLAVEDQHFFEHEGLDTKRIAGAALANLRALRIVQGASTITQQLAKNLFLSPKRSLTRKLREMAMAQTLERRYSKEDMRDRDPRCGAGSAILFRQGCEPTGHRRGGPAGRDHSRPQPLLALPPAGSGERTP